MFFSGLLRRGDRDHLDLRELMLTQHARRILAGRTRLGAETERMGGKAFRQFNLAHNALAHEVSEWHFGGRDHVMPLPRLVQILLELGELSGAEQAVTAHHHRRRDFEIAFLLRMHIEHEGRQRAFQPGNLAAGHDEPRTGDFCRRLEIHQSHSLAKLIMLLRIEIERRNIANPAQLDILRLVRAVGHVRIQNIGQFTKPSVERRL